MTVPPPPEEDPPTFTVVDESISIPTLTPDEEDEPLELEEEELPPV